MGNYTFTSKNGMCPQCNAFGRKYFIQDRPIDGRAYEYALMSCPSGKRQTLKFPDRHRLASWLVGMDISDDIAASLIISQHTVHDYPDMALLKKDRQMFVVKKEELSLREYIEPSQETGWFPAYAECLRMAKEILNRMESMAKDTEGQHDYSAWSPSKVEAMPPMRRGCGR